MMKDTTIKSIPTAANADEQSQPRIEPVAQPRKDQRARKLKPAIQHLRGHRTLSSIVDYAYTFDREGRFIYANQALLDLLGITLDEIVGKNFLDLPYPHDLAVRLQLQIEQVFITSRRLVDETPYTSPSGVFGYYEYIFNPVLGADGSVELVAGSTRNITARKESEAALIRTEKLIAAEGLAGALAHEINNPLQAVVNLIMLLRQSPNLNAQDLTYATLAEQELGRLSHLTKQSLTFYRDSTLPAAVKAEDLIDGVLELYATRIRGRKISIQKLIVPKEATINSYSGEVRQVLSTLLVNAIEAVPVGGSIAIRVRRSSHCKDPRLHGVRITVADSGVGIPANNLPLIFDAFFTTKGIRGTGLGLWVANGILNRLNGSIRVRSSAVPGKSGSCFSIFVPDQISKNA